MNKGYVRVYKETVITMVVISFIVLGIFVSIFLSAYYIFFSKSDIIVADDNILIEKNNIDVTEIVEIEVPVIQENEIEVINIVENIVEVEPLKLRKIGEFLLTSYCPCSICCGEWGGSPVGKTGAIGVGEYEGISVAVDPTVIPYGSKLYIDGVGVCIASDCGGGIKENRIDVYCEDHNKALQYGIFGGYAHDVYIIE